MKSRAVKCIQQFDDFDVNPTLDLNLYNLMTPMLVEETKVLKTYSISVSDEISMEQMTQVNGRQIVEIQFDVASTSFV